MPRLTRFSLGTKIDILFTDTLQLMLSAKYAPREQKLEYIRTLCTNIDAIKFFLQIAFELKALSAKKYSSVSIPLEEIGKMVGGWKKQLEKENPATKTSWQE